MLSGGDNVKICGFLPACALFLYEKSKNFFFKITNQLKKINNKKIISNINKKIKHKYYYI